MRPIITMAIERETDVVAVRQRARQIAGLLGFEHQDQTRVATAVSEIARNAFGYGGGGKAAFMLDDAGANQGLVMRISDHGPGIADLATILEGRYRSPQGMGIGILGARRLMDRFEIEQAPGAGVTVTMLKSLPRKAARVTAARLGEIGKELRHASLLDPLVEMREQNRELMRSLSEERVRQEELAQLNNELTDTNRGVVALYAELDEKAEQLRQASELKSRFLSNMTHEFRTPLNSVLALCELLLDETDGTLLAEQARQIGYIRKSALSLTELVDDLLDIAKVEAGKLDTKAAEFSIDELFGALRGALRPLRTSETVELIFDPPAGINRLFTDEAKVSQILRNFISNALKFTEAGEVRLSVRLTPDGEVVFAVRDTGVGISPEHHDSVFHEFAQVPNRLQGRVKGTGLGLSLSKRLAELLGGSVSLQSTPGVGSIFYLTLPSAVVLPASAPAARGADLAPVARRGPPRDLLLDDEETFRYVLRQMIGDDYEIFDAKNGAEGLERARALRPDTIFLDLHMPVLDGYAVLQALKEDALTETAQVFIATSSVLGPNEAMRLQAAAAIVSKKALSRTTIASMLGSGRAGEAR
jgi:signal transduction histidine kinase/CheY-like chemotaxis protein